LNVPKKHFWQLAKELPNEKGRAGVLEGENLNTLMGFFEADGKPPGHNPVSWAKKQLEQPANQLGGDLAAIRALTSQFDELVKLQQKISETAENEKKAATKVSEAERFLNLALESSGGDQSELLALFEAGKSFLEKHPNHPSCPLCESAEKSSGLMDRIRSGLSALGEIKKATEGKQKAEAWLNQARILYVAVKEEFTNKRAAFIKLVAGTKWRPEVKFPTNQIPENTDDLPGWLQVMGSAREAWSEIENNWVSSEKFRQALKNAVDQYDANLRNRMELEALIPKIDEALKICVEERQTFTDDVMSSIANEVGTLYERVHPGEGLNKIALPLDPKKRASIELAAKFAGKNVPPQAYFSQSHLDTLGLCVFLALALRNQPANTILVLDDVLGSVDEPHVERVIQTIYEVSKKFQHTIVTTHYRPWREKYRWGWLKPDQPCQFVELGNWTIDIGLKDVGSLPEIERLRTLLE
jgi:hypothetical protein